MKGKEFAVAGKHEQRLKKIQSLLLVLLMSASLLPLLQVTGAQNYVYEIRSTQGIINYPNVNYPPSQVKYFADDSYWYMKIKQNPTIHPNNDQMINWLMNNHANNPNINWQSWTHTLYDAYEDTPLYQVWDTERGFYRYIPFPDPYPIQIPLEADHSVTIIDWFRGKVWHLAEVVATGGGYTVRSAWYCEIGGSGVANTIGSGTWTVGGSGCPKAAYMIKPEEIEAGVINHALGVSLKPIGPWEGGSRYSMVKGFVYPPAVHTDRKVVAGYNTYEIPEGSRIQLDPAINLDTVAGLSATGKIVAKALQEYGMVAVEAGGSWAIYAEHDFTADWNPPYMSGSILNPIGALVTPTYNPWRVIAYDGLYPVQDDLSEYVYPT